MTVRVVFLGPLADLAGRSSMEVAAPCDWPALLDAVGPDVAAALDTRVHVACAGVVLADRATLSAKDGDEVALLPPVSGG